MQYNESIGEMPPTYELRQNGLTSGSHPNHESNLPKIDRWKWCGTLAVILLTSMINGYDVSNVANIQPRLYEVLGHIELLPWIGLSYSMSVFCVLPLAQKIIGCFDLRWTYICSLGVFIFGTGIAGAPDIFAVIVGRIIMGAAGAFAQQGNMTYLTLYSKPEYLTMNVAAVSSTWAIGLIIGGPIGSIFARDLSWRWAIYFPIPCVGAAFILALLCVPSYVFVLPQVSILQRLSHIDPLGILLNMVVPILFAIAVTFPNVVWNWSPGSFLVLWTIFGIFLAFWIAQQYWCLLTRFEERAIPIRILHRIDLLPIWVSTACAGSTYAIIIYYTPLFYAFSQGLDAIDQTVKMLPFTVVFIFTAMITGRLLPIIKRYGIIYVFGGFIASSGSVIMAAIMSSNSVTDSQIMGLEALIGIGLGLQFQHGLAISEIINKTQKDRADSLLVCNMAQMGGIAVTLAIAGSIFQNVGYDLLSGALKNEALSSHEIREALAGVSSTVWQNPLLLERATEAIAAVISREFFIPTSAGLLCFLCGLCMSGKILE